MFRLLIPFAALALFALAGAGFAQPPVDYTLLCAAEDEAGFDLENATAIGVATEVAGTLHVYLSDGWVCEDPYAVVAVALHDDSVVVEVDVAVDEDGAVTLTLIVGEPDGEANLSGTATALPQQAIDGMAKAHALRTAAFEHRNRGAETSAAAREAAGERERPRVELDESEAEEAEEQGRPDLPEPAGGRR